MTGISIIANTAWNRARKRKDPAICQRMEHGNFALTWEQVMLGRNTPHRLAAVVAIVFGVLTIASGGQALFGSPDARAAVGDAVPFVLWFNFVAGFFYVLAGLGLLTRRRWSAWVSVGILIATLGVFALFGIHVWRGGAYETRTVFAMIFRVVVWFGIAMVAMRGGTAQADLSTKRLV